MNKELCEPDITLVTSCLSGDDNTSRKRCMVNWECSVTSSGVRGIPQPIHEWIVAITITGDDVSPVTSVAYI